ncbi:MAG: glucosyltransferase domain-containing protein [Oscillospiraceae bacterium]|nr:glucosyltransferase domain-containing protein [Oscillospiraceae bacterium]
MTNHSTKFDRLKSHLRGKDAVVFGLFLLYAALVFSPFLAGQHRVHDSYLMELYGSYDFMIESLFNIGRLFSALFFQILYFLNPPFTWVMRISVAVSLVFLALSAYIVFCLLRRYAPSTAKRNGYILAALGSLMVFFNIFILETVLFLETSVMSFGILLTVVAAARFLRGGVKNYLLSLLCLIISVFCYLPGTIFFPPLVVLFLGAKHQTELRPLLRKIGLAILVFAGAMLVQFAFLTLISDDVRFAGDVLLTENVRQSGIFFARFMLNQLGFLPRLVFFAFLLGFFCILAVTCHKRKNYKALVLALLPTVAVFAALFAVYLPVATDNWYIMPRTAIAIASIGGLMILGIVLCAEKIGKPVLLIAVLFTLLISQRQIDIQQNTYANNRLDMQELNHIVETIRAYEAYHDIRVEQIFFTYDTPRSWFREGITDYSDLTIRVWQIPWMPRPLLQPYLGRDLTIFPMHMVMTDEEIEEVAARREYHWFTNGTFVFDEETVYIFFR